MEAIEALTESPTTSAMVTSVRPIISAAAVVAVRRELRAALRCASRPATPPVARIGKPNDRVTRPTASGLSTVTPTNSAIAPSAMPAPAEAGEARPATAGRQTADDERDTGDDPLAGGSCADCPTRPDRAAIGGTVAARRAGASAATRVTPIPVTAAAISVREGEDDRPVAEVDADAVRTARRSPWRWRCRRRCRPPRRARP